MLTPYPHLQDLATELSRGVDAVKALDPFKQIDESRACCKRVASQAANRWALREPEKKKSTDKMSWITYNAVIKRSGGPYYSRGREKREYDFPQDM